MEEKISFMSDGLRISGIVEKPADIKSGERRPVVMVLHGFGSNKQSGTSVITTKLFASMGYVTLRFDMRGCGESEGVRGKTICMEQVADTGNALTYMANRADVDPKRIAVLGHSFGAAVAVYAAGVDSRIAACISSGGWGDGPSKFRRQHESPEAWKKFTDMMEEGKRRLARGESMMVPRFDIVPIKPELRGNLSPGSIFEFPFEVVESMYNFKANEVVGNIAPRPLLLLHPANDTVTPTEQSVELFKRAKQPADLFLVSQVDHFIFSDESVVVQAVVRAWLAKHFPVHLK